MVAFAKRVVFSVAAGAVLAAVAAPVSASVVVIKPPLNLASVVVIKPPVAVASVVVIKPPLNLASVVVIKPPLA